MIAGYAGSQGVPAPKVAVAVSGLLLLIGGASILFDFQPMISVAAIALFLIPVTFMIHRFWTVQDPNQKMGERINFAKNMGLLGSTLMFLAIPQPWPFSITG
jgi:putative oxidoreductase